MWLSLPYAVVVIVVVATVVVVVFVLLLLFLGIVLTFAEHLCVPRDATSSINPREKVFSAVWEWPREEKGDGPGVKNVRLGDEKRQESTLPYSTTYMTRP